MEEEKKKSILEGLGIEAVFIGIVILLIVGILSYLNIIPLKKLIPSFNFNFFAATPKLVPATPVGLQCPVNYQYCKNAVSVQYNGHSTLLFNVPDKYSLYAMGNLLHTVNENTTIGKDIAKVVRAPFIYKNKCYTITYITHNSSTINPIAQYPFAKGGVLGFVTDKTLTLQGSSFNLLVQLQEKNLDPDTKKPDNLRCNITNPGSYVNLSSSSLD